jgi:hypothetical protein
MQTVPGVRCTRNNIVPTAGLWDFDGECKPEIVAVCASNQQTFSVSVFQWIPKSSGKGLKRSKAIKRITGSVNDFEKIYSKAELFCIDKDLEQPTA